MGKFRLTYASLGPTEMRLIIIAVFIIRMYCPFNDYTVDVFGQPWTVFDGIGALVAAALFLIYIGSLAKDLKELAKIDPPHKYNGK